MASEGVDNVHGNLAEHRFPRSEAGCTGGFEIGREGFAVFGSVSPHQTAHY